MKYYLGIDTSNYTTSAAVCDNENVLHNMKIPLKVNPGERGLRQNDAVFLHTRNIPVLLEGLKQYGYKYNAVGCAGFPRDAENSYMPCFLSGESAARSVAAVNNIPVYKFSHQAGHIAAAVYSSGKAELYNAEFIAFHVSGGTTEILYVNGKKIIKIGGTLDINAGQVIDRSGVKLGFGFPCGSEIEKSSLRCGEPIKVTASVRGNYCNLSGIENKVDDMIKSDYDRDHIAKYVIESIKITLEKLTENILNDIKYANLPVIYAGGVMGNKIISAYLKNKFNSYFAEPEYSSDNAAGIAILCRQADEKQNG